MRHAIGVGLAIVMLLVLFFAGAWGYLRLLRFPAPVGSISRLPAAGGSLLSHHNVLGAMAALIVTGLLAGALIGVPRISPLAAGLPGLILLGWSALYLITVHRAVGVIPMKSRAFGAGFEAMLINGVLAMVGTALVIPMFMPSRWLPPMAERNRARGEETDLLSQWSESEQPRTY